MSRSEADKVCEYIEQLYCPKDALLEEIRRELDPHSLGMQISPLEGKLLHVLTKLKNPKKVLEIGTLAGYSAIWMARAISEDAEVHTIEKSDKNLQRAKVNIAKFEMANNITIHHGAALDVLPTLQDIAPFDMVFIDADKENYPKYLEYAYQYTAPGALIVADNTLLFGLMLENEPDARNPGMWRGIAEFNKLLSDENRYISIMIPTKEGLSLAIKA